MEHPPARGEVPQSRGLFRGGDEQLHAGVVQQELQYPPLMSAIEFRGQVVQRDDGPVSMPVGIVARLGQQQGKGDKLGLAARQGLASWQPLQREAPVGPVRACSGVAAETVALPAQKQGIGQGEFLAAPARLELQSPQGKAMGKPGWLRAVCKRVPISLCMRSVSASVRWMASWVPVAPDCIQR